MSFSDDSTSPKTYVLRSSDGETFEVEEAVAVQSETIKHMIEDDCTDPAIPLPNVTGKTLAKIIEYCRRHVASAARTPPDDDGASAPVDEELKAFDAQYLRVDQETLYHLLLAANYLNIKNLLELTCQNVADMIKGKSPEQIRKTFNIKNDFTPEEEEAIHKETPWAFED